MSNSAIISFEIQRYFQKTLEELSLEKCVGDNIRTASDNLLIFNYARFEPCIEKAKSKSMAEGKKIFYGKKIENLFGKEEYIDFIVDIDENNQEKRLSCKQKDEDRTLKLTPIFFKKEVLNKYYENSRCTVRQGRIEHPAWILQADIDNDDYVVVYLYKLAFLPSEEQHYWRSYNLPRESRTMSLSFFRSTILGEFCEAENRIDKFKFLYSQINPFWERKFGFKLYLDFHEDDEYNLNGLNDIVKSQKDLDAALLRLAKILTDAISVSELKSWLSNYKVERDDGKIKILEEFLKEKNLIDLKLVTELIGLLKEVQTYRSRAAAHNKGGSYDKLVKQEPKLKSSPEKYFKEIIDKLNAIFMNIIES